MVEVDDPQLPQGVVRHEAGRVVQEQELPEPSPGDTRLPAHCTCVSQVSDQGGQEDIRAQVRQDRLEGMMVMKFMNT